MIEPKPLCRNCEYFDCEGKNQETLPPLYRGDCLNQHGRYFNPLADDTCRSFWPDSTRWPDVDCN